MYKVFIADGFISRDIIQLWTSVIKYTCHLAV